MMIIGHVNQPPVGDLAGLSTTARESAVAAINEVDANIGNLTGLVTSSKLSTVAAINEVQTGVDAVNDRIDDLIINSGTSDAEVIDARGAFDLLSDRLDASSRGVFTPEAYGAIGNGVADDSAAMQAALDAIKTAGGGTLKLSAQYYIGASALKYQSASASLTIEGTGKYSGAGRSAIIGNGSPIILDLIGSDRCVMRNFSIETSGVCDVGLLLARKNGSTASSGITLDNVCIVGDFAKACVYSINSEVNRVVGCEIRSVSNAAGSHAVYLSTENDLSVVSDGGTISQSADGATNTVVVFVGNAIMHYGTYGIALGIYGGSRCINLDGCFFYSPISDIFIGPSSAVTSMLGPINIRACSFEGNATTKGLHLGDVLVYAIDVSNCLFSLSGAGDGQEIYQDTVTPGRGIYNCRIYNNRYTSSVNFSLHTIGYSIVHGASGILRKLATACEWQDVLTLTYDATAQDLSSVRSGRIASTERRLVLGPAPTTVNSDNATYSTIQIRPSFSAKTLTTADAGAIVAWNGQYSSQPNGSILNPAGTGFRPSLFYWSGSEYLPLSLPRRELFRSEIPTDNSLWKISDIIWNSAVAAGGTVGWICTRTGFAAATWKPNQAYSVGDYVLPTTDNTKYFRCTTAGTSGASEPAWNTGAGTTTNDNTAIWTNQGTSALFKPWGAISA